MQLYLFLTFFFFNDTATTEIYTLSLHDALPISPFRYWALKASTKHRTPPVSMTRSSSAGLSSMFRLYLKPEHPPGRDRKSTRLNSSHSQISYAVFCLKKKRDPYSSCWLARSTIG